MPAGVQQVRVLAIGGGGGGQKGDKCGARSGHLNSTTLPVQAGTNYRIKVGNGGPPGRDGGESKINDTLTAAGGKSDTAWECYEFEHPDDGNWTLILSIIKNQNISEGPPGNRNGRGAGGPGGGGILINGKGPQAEFLNDDNTTLIGRGGHGYGAGAGASGPRKDAYGNHYIGGTGLSGLVYIEWD